MKTQIIITIFFVLGYVAAQTEPPPSPTPDPDFECPDDSDAFYPDPTDCSSYYECTNGLAWHFTCPANLYYNYQTKLCDYPKNVDCEGRPTPNPMMDMERDYIGPAPDHNCTANGAWPHEELCDLYYDCWEGDATLYRCTQPMLFDTVYSGCNHPEMVDCHGLLRPNGTGVDPTTQPPYTGPTDPTEFVCPEVDGLYKDPKDCHYYYQCVEQEPYHFQCPGELVFNPVTTTCDYLSNVPSCQTPAPPSFLFE